MMILPKECPQLTEGDIQALSRWDAPSPQRHRPTDHATTHQHWLLAKD
jgi:hypothetical protein